MDYNFGFMFACLLTLANSLSVIEPLLEAPLVTPVQQTKFSHCGFTLNATCDDKMVLFADGVELARSDDWKVTSIIDIPANTRLLEIQCTDGWIVGGILASSDNGLITNDNWVCSADNGNTWNPAHEIGENGMTSKNIKAEAKWIWTPPNTWKHTATKKHTTARCKINLESSCPTTTTTTPPTTTISTTISPYLECPYTDKYLDCPSWKEHCTSGLADCMNDKCAKTCKCKPKTKVLWLGPNPWTTLTLPDFAPASSECSIPKPTGEYTVDYYQGQYYYGFHFLFTESTAHTQVINGTLYECDWYSCKSYDGNQWKVKDPRKMKFTKIRSWAASALIPGPQPKWIVNGGEGGYAPNPFVWTPGDGNWKEDRNIRSPDPVDLHCIVLINGTILQVAGRSKSGYSKRVFLGDVEVASLKEVRLYHTCAYFNKQTWVAGGTNGNHGHLPQTHGSVDVYDHTTDTWTDGPALPFEVNDGRPKLMVIQGNLYYIGGTEVGKVFQLGDGNWDEIADIPKGGKTIAQIVEKTC